MKDMLKYLDARLGEPATWASIATLLALLGVNIDPGTLHAWSLWAAIVASGLGILLKETGTKPPMAIGADLLATLVSGIKALPAPQPADNGQGSVVAKTVAMVLVSGGLVMTLSACQLGADALVDLGVSPSTAQTISADTAEAGQLFCTDGTTLLAASGVNVTGASPASVAKACAMAQAIGATTPPATTPVPIAAPAGAQAVLAVVPDAVAAAVLASKTATPASAS